MNTLTFDTSGPFCAVHATGAAARVAMMKSGQSERLFPLIEEVLANAGLTRSDLDLICVGVGPGNFTGTRIGVAAARGLALSLGIPSVGVSRLEALSRLAPGKTAAVAAYKGHTFVQAPGKDPSLVTTDSLQLSTLVVDETFPDVGDAQIFPLAKLLPQMATIAAGRRDGPPPAPLYLRAPDAALPSEPPPKILS